MTSNLERNEEKTMERRSEKYNSSILRFFNLSENVSHLDLFKQMSAEEHLR